MSTELRETLKDLQKALTHEANMRKDLTDAEIVLEAKQAEIAIATRTDGQKRTEAHIQEVVINNDVIYRMKMAVAARQYQYDLAKNTVKLQGRLLDIIQKAEEEPPRTATTFNELFQ